MRLKIDENVPLEVAAQLRAAGHDAHSVYDEALSGAGDQTLAAVCRRERRALLTLDLDFADIRTYPPADFAGLIVLRLMRQDKAHVLATVQRLLPLLNREALDRCLWIVDEQRVRVRQ